MIQTVNDNVSNNACTIAYVLSTHGYTVWHASSLLSTYSLSTSSLCPMFLHLHEDTVALQVHVPEIQPATDHLPRPCVPIYDSWEVSLLILRY